MAASKLKYKVIVHDDWNEMDYMKTRLFVTHNGYRWRSINILDPHYEIPLIIKALNKYLKEHKRHEENL